MMSRIAWKTAILKLVAEIGNYLAALDCEGIEDVRGGIARWSKGELRDVPPRHSPACAQLGAALDAMGETQLSKAIAEARGYLSWTAYDLYPLEQIGADFAAGHAFASLIGENAFLEASDFDLGLFIIEPHVFYRDHHHAAPELYAPLTGPHGWRFKPGDPLIWKPAHEPVWNEAWKPHATMVGDQPFLCIFCWTRDVSEPARVIPSADWVALEKTR